MLRSHETGGPGPVKLREQYGPVGSPYESILLRCAWSHAYGRSTGSLCIFDHGVCVPYGFRKGVPYRLGSVSCTCRNRTGPCRCRKGSCGCRTGLATRVRKSTAKVVPVHATGTTFLQAVRVQKSPKNRAGPQLSAKAPSCDVHGVGVPYELGSVSCTFRNRTGPCRCRKDSCGCRTGLATLVRKSTAKVVPVHATGTTFLQAVRVQKSPKKIVRARNYQRKHPPAMCMVTCILAFYGFSVYFWPRVCVPYGFRKGVSYGLGSVSCTCRNRTGLCRCRKGSCGCRTGLATPVRKPTIKVVHDFSTGRTDPKISKQSCGPAIISGSSGFWPAQGP